VHGYGLLLYGIIKINVQLFNPKTLCLNTRDEVVSYYPSNMRYTMETPAA